MIIDRSKLLVEKLVISRGHDKPPFSPYKFANLLQITEIVKADLGKLSAMLLRINGGYVLKVNERHSITRQNFSLAHEIGHVLLDEMSKKNIIQPVEFRTFNPPAQKRAYMQAKERLCDIAAAELLMPENIYKKYLLNLGVSIDTIEKLSNLFKVSLLASAIRASELSDIPSSIMMWKMDSRTGSKTLHMLWHKESRASELISNDWRTFFKNQQTFPSSLHNAYQNESAVTHFRTFKTNSGIKRIPIESKGFGNNGARFVLSLAFLNNKKNSD